MDGKIRNFQEKYEELAKL